jgi:hypothetical protein
MSKPATIKSFYTRTLRRFILRDGEDSKLAELIGDAYLDGCMDADTIPSEGKEPEEWFTIG